MLGINRSMERFCCARPLAEASILAILISACVDEDCVSIMLAIAGTESSWFAGGWDID